MGLADSDPCFLHGTAQGRASLVVGPSNRGDWGADSGLLSTSHHHIIFMGDMNFRFDTPTSPRLLFSLSPGLSSLYCTPSGLLTRLLSGHSPTKRISIFPSPPSTAVSTQAWLIVLPHAAEPLTLITSSGMRSQVRPLSSARSFGASLPLLLKLFLPQ